MNARSVVTLITTLQRNASEFARKVREGRVRSGVEDARREESKRMSMIWRKER